MTKPAQKPNRKSPSRGELCGAKKVGGGTCKHPAGLGTDHLGWGKCKFHGGTSSSLSTAAHRQRAGELAFEAVQTLGLDVRVDPARALLEELWRTAGHVVWLRAEIEKMGVGDLVHLTELGTKPRAFMDIYQRERTHYAKVASMALAAGVAERQVKIAEAQGALVAQAIRAILGELGLNPEQEAAAPGIVRRHLMSIPTEEAG